MIKELEEIINLQKEIDKLNDEQVELKHKKYNLEHSEEYNKLVEIVGKKIILEQKIKKYYENYNGIINKLNKICIPAAFIIAIIFVTLGLFNFLFYSILTTVGGMIFTYMAFKKATEKEEKAIENVDIKKLEEEFKNIKEEIDYQQKVKNTIKRKIDKYYDLCELKAKKVEVLKDKRDIIISNTKNKINKIGTRNIMNDDDHSIINEKVKKYSLQIKKKNI